MKKNFKDKVKYSNRKLREWTFALKILMIVQLKFFYKENCLLNGLKTSIHS